MYVYIYIIIIVMNTIIFIAPSNYAETCADLPKVFAFDRFAIVPRRS